MHSTYALDLDEWLRGERDWRNLFDLLDWVPRGGAYWSALAEDRELAEEMFDPDAPDPEPAQYPPHFGWTDLRADLAEMKDLILQAIYVSARSEKPPPTVPRPRPAIEVLKEQAARVRHSDFARRLGFGGD